MIHYRSNSVWGRANILGEITAQRAKHSGPKSPDWRISLCHVYRTILTQNSHEIFYLNPSCFFKRSWVSDAFILEHSWILQLDVIYCVRKCLNDSWIFQVMAYSACARAWILLTTPAVHRVWRAAWILFSGIQAPRVPIAYSRLEFLTRTFRFCWLNFADWILQPCSH